MPSTTTDVVTVRSDMMTMIETKTTTSEMTKSEMNKTNETKHEASGCACGPHELRTRDREPKNCETNRPSAQAPDPKSSKPHEL